MQVKKKILFVLPSLCAGGAERVMSFVAQQLDNSIFETKLLVLGFKSDAVYNVDTIPVHYLNEKRLLSSVQKLFSYIKSEKPSIVISSIGHVNLMMGFFSFYFKSIQFVGREASVVSKMNEYAEINSNITSFLMKIFYPKLAAIICQSEDMKNDFIQTYGIKQSKLFLIHNPITAIDNQLIEKESKATIKFITVGRLSEEKGYFRILSGLSKINKYSFHYTIIGSGPQMEKIKEYVFELKLGEKVSFIPYTSEILSELRKRDYFIQGSFVEGFPNALLESCSVGVPVIAFKAPGGTKDIVVDGLNGYLVNSEDEFITVLNDIDKLRALNSKEVMDSVHDKFNATRIIKQYENLLIKL